MTDLTVKAPEEEPAKTLRTIYSILYSVA